MPFTYIYTILLKLYFCHFQDQSKKFDSKKNVWIPDPTDVYIAAEIKTLKGDNVVVVTKQGNEVNFYVSHLSFACHIRIIDVSLR